MIVRMWRGESTAEDGPRYVDHLERLVFPQLREIEGHQGANLLQRTVGDRVEFIVITLWQSMDAIRRFAGDAPATAVVEPEARAVLSDFDETVDHYEVVLGIMAPASPSPANSGSIGRAGHLTRPRLDA